MLTSGLYTYTYMHVSTSACIGVCTHEHMRIPPHAYYYTHIFCPIRKDDLRRSVNGDANYITDTPDATENSQDSHCPCSFLKKLS